MNIAETIQEKVFQLPPKAQEEVLEVVERIASRYEKSKPAAEHPLTVIADLATDLGITDLADRHDFYAHGRKED